MTTDKISLVDYYNARECVVLFWVSIGCPMGQSIAMGYEHETFDTDRDLLDLMGTIDDGGEWNWDGEGNPTDHRLNTITRLTAGPDEATWNSLVAEYESECV